MEKTYKMGEPLNMVPKKKYDDMRKFLKEIWPKEYKKLSKEDQEMAVLKLTNHLFFIDKFLRNVGYYYRFGRDLRNYAIEYSDFLRYALSKHLKRKKSIIASFDGWTHISSPMSKSYGIADTKRHVDVYAGGPTNRANKHIFH